MSRDLCKLPKGARAPLQVKSVKDRENNPLHALRIHKTHHRSGPPSHFDEAPLNHIGRPELAPEGPRALEEREQLGQIPEQPRHELRVGLPPPTGEGLRLGHRLGATRRLIDRLGIRLHRRVIPPPGRAQQIPKLVDPTALMGHAGIDRLECRGQPGTAIGHHEVELPPLEASSIQIHQQSFPRRLALPRAPRKGQQLSRPIAPHSVGHQELDSLAAAWSSHSETDAIEKQIPPVIRQGGLMKLRHRLI